MRAVAVRAYVLPVGGIQPTVATILRTGESDFYGSGSAALASYALPSAYAHRCSLLSRTDSVSSAVFDAHTMSVAACSFVCLSPNSALGTSPMSLTAYQYSYNGANCSVSDSRGFLLFHSFILVRSACNN